MNGLDFLALCFLEDKLVYLRRCKEDSIEPTEWTHFGIQEYEQRKDGIFVSVSEFKPYTLSDRIKRLENNIVEIKSLKDKDGVKEDGMAD